MTEIKAVVFDMDGLMFDTEKLWVDAVVKTNEIDGYNVPMWLVVECIGLRNDVGDEKIKAYMGEDFDIKKFRELNKKYMEEDVRENGLRVKKGLRELLEFLRARGIKLAVASSSPLERIHQRFSEANLDKEYFDYFIGGNMVTVSKPDPQIYQISCREIGVDAKYVIALEDSDAGIMAAHLAGLRPILIPDIKVPKKETEEIAYRKFEDLLGVMSLFED